MYSLVFRHKRFPFAIGESEYMRDENEEDDGADDEDEDESSLGCYV